MKSKNNKEDLTIAIWHYIRDNYLDGDAEAQRIQYDEYGADIYAFVPFRINFNGNNWRIDYNENPDEKVMLITVMQDTGEYDKRYLN